MLPPLALSSTPGSHDLTPPNFYLIYSPHCVLLCGLLLVPRLLLAARFACMFFHDAIATQMTIFLWVSFLKPERDAIKDGLISFSIKGDKEFFNLVVDPLQLLHGGVVPRRCTLRIGHLNHICRACCRFSAATFVSSCMLSCMLERKL